MMALPLLLGLARVVGPAALKKVAKSAVKKTVKKKTKKSSSVKKAVAKETKLDKKFAKTGTTGKAGRRQSTTNIKVDKPEVRGTSARKEAPLRSPKKKGFTSQATGSTPKRKGSAIKKKVAKR